MPAPRPLSRRSLLRRTGTGLAVAATGAGTRLGTGTPTGWSVALPQDVRVMTRNLGLGTRLSRLLDVEDRSVDPASVHEAYREVLESAPAARMDAVAGEVADELPAVVGLQEAALVRRGPSDYAGGSTPNAEARVVDFLAELRESLEAATDVTYRPVAVVETADEEFPATPADSGTGHFDVRLTDRDAVLVREDVAVRGTETRNYAIGISFALRDGTRFSVNRGYGLVEATLDGAPFTVVNTHLESVSATVRRAQAGQLLGRLDGVEGPIVLLGDLNSGPTSETPSVYDSVASSFTDAWVAARGDRRGPTCCQLASLRNDGSRLSRRLDHVFVAGQTTVRAVRRVGADPQRRVRAEVDGSDVRVWPSDHAGVVADLRIEPQVSVVTALRALLTP